MVLQPTGALKALVAMPTMELLASLVEGDIPAYISMPGKPGHTNVRLHMNPTMAAPVRARDFVASIEAVVAAMEFGARTETDPL